MRWEAAAGGAPASHDPGTGAAGGAALRISESVRNAARSRALATLPAERAGLLVGMALGDTSLLPAELEGDFRAAGLTHLMAVSGANLAVVLAAGLAGRGGWCRPPGPGRRRDRAGGPAGRRHPLGAERAAGRCHGRPGPARCRDRARPGRPPCPLPGRGGAAAGRPGLAGALRFQLSVAATAGVLWLGPAVAEALPDRVPDASAGPPA